MVKKNKSAILVFNPRAGRGKSLKRSQSLQNDFSRRLGIPLTLRATRSLHDLHSAVQEAADYDIAVFMGGDGTLSECLQSMAKLNRFKNLQKPVGLLPAGTGNSFIRDFGLTSFSEAQGALFEALEHNLVMNIDAGLVTYSDSEKNLPANKQQRLVINIWGAGLVAEIAELAMRMRYLGSLNYTVASLKKILTHNIKNWQLALDSKTIAETKANFVVVSNSRFTGGAMEIAPGVRVNDGRLFLVLPQITGKLNLLTTFPKIFKGEHVQHPRIETGFVKNLSIKAGEPVLMLVDGEVIPAYNPQIKVKKAFWKMYINPARLLP